MAIDWLKIKTEYISTAISTRKLAEKHGVSASIVMKRAASEKWAAQRTEQASKIEAKVKQKTASKIASSEVSRIACLLSLSDKLGEKLGANIAQLNNKDARSLQQLSAALKNLKDMVTTLDTQTGGTEDDGFLNALDHQAEPLWAEPDDSNDAWAADDDTLTLETEETS